jgi:hypothetical protein
MIKFCFNKFSRRFNSTTTSNNNNFRVIKKHNKFSVDRSGLLLGSFEKNDENNPEIKNKTKEEITPLAKELISTIKLRGPISIHEYVSLALNHSTHGYYQHKHNKIGLEGDFITSPEVSQLFGEMIALWCLDMWHSMGCPPQFILSELGPGNGTLMKDILRISEKFPKFKSALNIHLVELSNKMRKKQCTALSVNDNLGEINSVIKKCK